MTLAQKNIHKTEKRPIVILVACGTGGHVYPALAVKDHLNKNNRTIIWSDGRGARFLNTPCLKLQPKTLFTKKRRNTWFTLLTFAQHFISALRTFYRLKPHVVWGFGGSASIAPLLAAKCLNITIGAHQADAFIGKANRFAVNYLHAHLTLSFEPTYGPQSFVDNIERRLVAKKSCGHTPHNTSLISPKRDDVIVGLPIRHGQQFHHKANDQHEADKNILRILITGGSQGAEFWYHVLPKAVALMTPAHQKRLHITHQVPLKHARHTLYGETQSTVYICPFIKDMAQALCKTDIHFMRAGGSSIVETFLAGCSAVVVPLPSSAEHHQIYNAYALKDLINDAYDPTLPLNAPQPFVHILSQKQCTAQLFCDLLTKILEKGLQSAMAFNPNDTQNPSQTQQILNKGMGLKNKKNALEAHYNSSTIAASLQELIARQKSAQMPFTITPSHHHNRRLFYAHSALRLARHIEQYIKSLTK